MEPHQARSGRDLAKQLSTAPRAASITTIIDKFENAVLKGNLRNESDNIFVLVDESHRGQYGAMHGRMRKALPNACFIGFTGTPVQKKEKDTINKFGGLIQPPTRFARPSRTRRSYRCFTKAGTWSSASTGRPSTAGSTSLRRT